MHKLEVSLWDFIHGKRVRFLFLFFYFFYFSYGKNEYFDDYMLLQFVRRVTVCRSFNPFTRGHGYESFGDGVYSSLLRVSSIRTECLQKCLVHYKIPTELLSTFFFSPYLLTLPVTPTKGSYVRSERVVDTWNFFKSFLYLEYLPSTDWILIGRVINVIKVIH